VSASAPAAQWSGGVHGFNLLPRGIGRNAVTALVLVALVYAVLFVLVNGQIDVPFLYSNPGN
jgi:hypothetical protein